VFLVLTTMLASGVEFVEALTIILATGLTRGWRSALLGTAAAVLALAAAVAVLGISLARYIHIEVLHLIVGVLLTIFGLQWLRKAVLRAAGLKALHDEEAIFSREVAELHRPLSRVPENAMKFCVGLLLFTFGTFWAGEGVGIQWQWGDAMILALLGMYALASWALVQVLRRRTALVAEEGRA
jgi:uncharacterized membrane protein